MTTHEIGCGDQFGGPEFASANTILRDLVIGVAESTFKSFSQDELIAISIKLGRFLAEHARNLGYHRRAIENAGYCWSSIEDRTIDRVIRDDAAGLESAFEDPHYDSFCAFLKTIHANDGIALFVVLAILLRQATTMSSPFDSSQMETLVRLIPIAIRKVMSAAAYGASQFESHSRGGRNGEGGTKRRDLGSDSELENIVTDYRRNGIADRKLQSTIRERYGERFGCEGYLRKRIKKFLGPN